MNRKTISIHFVNAALHGARRLELDIESLVSRAGMDPALLLQPKARVSPEQYTRLAQVLWLATQDEHVGFGTTPRHLGTFATMCQLIIHAGTLGRALERGQQFYSLFGSDWSMSISNDLHEARLRVNVPQDLDVDHYITESMLMVWHGLASWLIGRRIPLERVKFGYPKPQHADEYDALFFAPTMTYDENFTEVSFAADYLSLPIRQTEDTLVEFLKIAPAKLLFKFKNTNSLTSRIRELLKSHIGHDMPTLNVVAANLYLSPQTLRRRLAAEGKSYQGVKDDLRRDTAIHLLGMHNITLDEVAEKVGFSETSTFHRAFKKWTGVTPGLYRQIHAD
jgi:AraC-like DNA-binding protein